MRTKLVLIATVLVGGLLYYFLNSNPLAHDHDDHDHDHNHEHGAGTDTLSVVEDDVGHTEHETNSSAATLPSIIASFNYKQEAQKILNLAKQWPASKSMLLQITLGEDEFKKNNISVAPHTANEIRQRQMAAVKIMSLRVLLEKELSKEKKLQDLDYIVNNAKDATLKTIATEAKKSELNNRPFFEDTLDAISNIEINN